VSELPPPEPPIPDLSEPFLLQPPAPDPAPWGLRGAITVVFLAMATQVVLALLLTGFAGLVLSAGSSELADRPDDLAEAATQVSILPLALASSLASLALVYISVVAHHRRPFLASIGLTRPSLRGLLASAGFGCGVNLLGVAVMTIFPYEGSSESLGPLTRLANSGTLGMIIWLALALGMAPIVEEILFRGYAYAGARRSLGAAGAGLAVTSVFLLLHVFETGWYWPALAGIGLLAAVLVILRERTGNLTYCIVCHLGYNATLAMVAMLDMFGG